MTGLSNQLISFRLLSLLRRQGNATTYLVLFFLQGSNKETQVKKPLTNFHYSSFLRIAIDCS